jgi:hypothetical protein
MRTQTREKLLVFEPDVLISVYQAVAKESVRAVGECDGKVVANTLDLAPALVDRRSFERAPLDVRLQELSVRAFGGTSTRR